MKPDISVIIPCYNVENYILGTLRSLEQQKYKYFKVILVDDGSSDNTVRQVRQYLLSSNLDVTLFQQSNRGVSSARNKGISLVDTAYICFLDADDVYSPEFLLVLHDSITKFNVDLSLCRYQMMHENQNTVKENSYSQKYEQLNRFEMMKKYAHHKIEHINFWCGMYKYDLIQQNNLSFSIDIKYGEDSEFISKYLKQCIHDCIVVNMSLYFYMIRKGSVMQQIKYDRIQVILAYKNIVKYWGDDLDPLLSSFLVSRSIWSVAKDFAAYDDSFFKQLRKKYDIRYAMNVMLKQGDEPLIKISAFLYLLHPILFQRMITLYYRIF